jgi:pSer/pThr/pTyr-binding forkhead associated (FHA) protein
MEHMHTSWGIELPQLHLIQTGQPGHAVALQGTMTIGRDITNDIIRDSATVSRSHALLLCDTTGLWLIDLASTNGTLVNGVLTPPDEPVRLADGDLIQLGQVLARYVTPSQGGPPWMPRARRRAIASRSGRQGESGGAVS